MKLRTKIAAVVASVALLFGLGVAPAGAIYGNSVGNFSTGWVLVEKDGGQRVWLAGYGARTNNVNWVVITQHSCVLIGPNRYCATYQAYSVKLGLAQYVVKRVS